MMKFLQRIRTKLYAKRVFFQYSGFYDFPMGIMADYNGRKYLLERWFDDELDDYEDSYRVYDITNISLREGEQIWDDLDDFRNQPLCTIPVKEISFDESRRSWIEAAVFQKFQNVAKDEKRTSQTN